MKQLSYVLCGLVLFAALELTVAQNVSATVDPTANLGVPLYIYNFHSASIVSQNGSGLFMTPVASYNTTMQWTVTQNTIIYQTYVISSVSSGCKWNAPPSSPVSTVCPPDTSLAATDFIFTPNVAGDAYHIVQNENVARCVTDVDGVVSSPAPACNRQGAYTQWRFVTISP